MTVAELIKDLEMTDRHFGDIEVSLAVFSGKNYTIEGLAYDPEDASEEAIYLIQSSEYCSLDGEVISSLGWDLNCLSSNINPTDYF